MNATRSINDAVRLHQSGRLDEAEAIYRQILAQKPNDSGALQMLGVLLGQRGDKQAAIDHITRAIELDPSSLEAHLNLSLIYLEIGDGANAARVAREALKIAPTHHRAFYHLGNALKLMGQIAESVECFQQAVADKADFVPAMRSLADTFRRLGRDSEADRWLDEALKWRPDDLEALGARGEHLFKQKRFAASADVFQRFIKTHPNHWSGYNGLGAALFELGRTEQAVPLFEKAVELAPRAAAAHNSLGHAYTILHRLDQAIPTLQTAYRLDPQSVDIINNLAYALLLVGQPDPAIELLHKAIALQPDMCQTYSNLGNTYLARMETALAMDQYDRSIYLKPDHAEAHWNKALLHLVLGQFVPGWIEHEWRWVKFAEHRRNFRRPLWIGGDVSGKTILLYGEQGLGDSIQFSRFASDVAWRGATVVLECPAALAPLLGRIEGVSTVVPRGEPLPAFDFHCPMLSLPYAMGIDSPQKIPRVECYLSAPEEKTQAWNQLLQPHQNELKVGIVWAGAPKHSRDHERSIPAALLGPLAGVQGVRFFNLQKSIEGKPIAAPAMEMLDFTDRLLDFSDTAALVSQLDLVITVDTSVAHLAGALGRPVWTMITFHPDWRWLLNRSDTPWYPSMRLFRQRRSRDWESVIAEVVKELEKYAAANRRS